LRIPETSGARLGPEPVNNVNSPLFLSQNIPTISGTTYDLTFWLATPGGTGAGSPSEATASWNGTQVFDLSDVNSGMPYQQFTISGLSATSSSTSLQFSFFVNEGYWFLDDVSVTPAAVPEPSAIYLIFLGLSFVAYRCMRTVTRNT
jgi:hypothetical protein